MGGKRDGKTAGKQRKRERPRDGAGEKKVRIFGPGNEVVIDPRYYGVCSQQLLVVVEIQAETLLLGAIPLSLPSQRGPAQPAAARALSFIIILCVIPGLTASDSTA